MKVLTERLAEKFLEKKGFEIIEGIFIKKKLGIKKAIKKLGFPFVMKVSGKKIVHKNKVGGIKLGIKNPKEAIKAFEELKKIKGFEGVMIQKPGKGKEFLLGIKKTPEFGHVIAFGAGGIHTEELKDVSFRVYPFDRTEGKKMIKEVKKSKGLTKKNISDIEKNFSKLFRLIKKYPKIKELDINPLMIDKTNATIVDARIVFE
jgi:succinyl-CoA synthetase beta subunit